MIERVFSSIGDGGADCTAQVAQTAHKKIQKACLHLHIFEALSFQMGIKSCQNTVNIRNRRPYPRDIPPLIPKEAAT